MRRRTTILCLITAIIITFCSCGDVEQAETQEVIKITPDSVGHVLFEAEGVTAKIESFNYNEGSGAPYEMMISIDNQYTGDADAVDFYVGDDISINDYMLDEVYFGDAFLMDGVLAGKKGVGTVDFGEPSSSDFDTENWTEITGTLGFYEDYDCDEPFATFPVTISRTCWE